MAVRIVPFRNKNDEVEYHIVGRDSFSDFDSILELLKNQEGVTVLEVLDGIYWTIGFLHRTGTDFKLIFHEDVGIYALCLDQDPEENRKLLDILEKAFKQ